MAEDDGAEVASSVKASEIARAQLESIKPTPEQRRLTKSLPECEVCQGCAHNLTDVVEPQRFLGIEYQAEAGSTPSHIYRTQHPFSRRGDHAAVVKIACMPFAKRTLHNAPSAANGGCDGNNIDRVVATVVAQDKLANECGFESIVPRMWIGPVQSVTPRKGFYVSWDALWMEEAPGVSLDMLTFTQGRVVGQPNKVDLLPRKKVHDLLFNKLKSEEVVLAAIWDLLTMQCDRHGQNLYIDSDGHITLIDLDQALGDAWRVCGYDSMFLPTSQKHTINTLGYWYTMKMPFGKPFKTPAKQYIPMQHYFDYRCHAPGGEIGFDYPPKVTQCLKRISEMTVQEVQEEFGLVKAFKAVRLHRRASDMIQKGFEWTLHNGEPRNARAHRYPLTPPCCRLRVAGSQAVCLEKRKRWRMPRDTLPCGCSYSGLDPMHHIWEQQCADRSGRRRTGFWKLASGHKHANPLTKSHRKALQEWTLLERPAAPRNNESHWVVNFPKEWVNATRAGDWRNVTLGPT